jgi:hypothetical protein
MTNSNSSREIGMKEKAVRYAVKGSAVAAVGALAVIGVKDILNNQFGIHLNLPGLESQPPVISGQVLPNSTVVTHEQLTSCTDEVSVDVGVLSHDKYLAVSGYKADHMYPVKYAECGQDGLTLNVQKHYNASSMVDAVTVSVPHYKPINAGIDFNDGQVLCMDLPSTSSVGDVHAKSQSYNSMKKKNQTIHCNWGQNTTGLGFDTPNDAASNTIGSLQFAQNAAVLSPLPKYAEEQILSDVRQKTMTDIQAEYPNAKVKVILPRFKSQLEQIENNWESQSSDIMNGIKSISFSSDSGSTVINMNSRYDGINGSVKLPVDLSQKDLTKLNQFVHTSN